MLNSLNKSRRLSLRFSAKHFAALCLLLWISSANASAAATAAHNDAQAQHILQNTSNFYKELASFSGQLHVDVQTRHNGPWQHERTRLQFKMKRPDDFAISVKQKHMSGTAVIKGVNCWLYSPEWNMYIKKQSANWIDVFSDSDFGFIANLDPESSFLEAIVSSNPVDLIMNGVDDVRDSGIETCSGVKCHHLILTKDGSNIDLWLKTGKRPWIVKILPYKHYDQNMDAIMSITYDCLKANPKVKPKPFRAPVRATEVNHFVVAPEEEARHPLVQQPAPDFQLDTIGGKPFKLSEHRKQLLIIDFWATWCGPCCRELPVLSDIAQSYKDHNVALLAIDQEEEPEKIRTFLKKSDLKLHVALDRDGKVCKQYHVGGIPQTVLIDGNGVVRFVHIGNSDNLKEELTKEIETILHSAKALPKAGGTQ